MRSRWPWLVSVLLIVGALVVFWQGVPRMTKSSDPGDGTRPSEQVRKPPPDGCQIATFGAGCFWCTEAVFQQLKGVHAAVSGYSGGSDKNPTYQQVCSGTTGHAEVIQITFDPKVLSYSDLLEVFWKTHDPTTLNRQGNDRGTQYRSAIFYHTADQQKLAEHYKAELGAAGAFTAPIVTEIVPFSEFYPAEAYHQNYYLENSRRPYCSMVIRPKLEKFQKVFKNKLKSLCCATPPAVLRRRCSRSVQ